ncbi:hypothetical protein BS50DRAFT_383628 [Corynespora cassiicola Philippines]|uniref:Uncharacterized protein n=1 Tax=Corynespora cassiicola Philippines TaxID=1448308 RepID=A0A2T2NPG6_CORCC|nr:hypothetical protein BS50DRAFT_383628 [Corynespora cassiicola Philippines]
MARSEKQAFQCMRSPHDQQFQALRTAFSGRYIAFSTKASALCWVDETAGDSLIDVGAPVVYPRCHLALCRTCRRTKLQDLRPRLDWHKVIVCAPQSHAKCDSECGERRPSPDLAMVAGRYRLGSSCRCPPTALGDACRLLPWKQIYRRAEYPHHTFFRRFVDVEKGCPCAHEDCRATRLLRLPTMPPVGPRTPSIPLDPSAWEPKK